MKLAHASLFLSLSLSLKALHVVFTPPVRTRHSSGRGPRVLTDRRSTNRDAADTQQHTSQEKGARRRAARRRHLRARRRRLAPSIPLIPLAASPSSSSGDG